MKKFKEFLYLLSIGCTENRVLDWVSDKIHDFLNFFRIRKERIEKFFYWGWKLRNNHDWDYAFLYEIMYLKLTRMRISFLEKGNCVWNQDVKSEEYQKLMPKLDKAINLSYNLFNSSNPMFYKEELWDKHEQKWGEYIHEDSKISYTGTGKELYKMNFHRVKVVDEETRNREQEDSKKIIDECVRAYHKDKKELYDILRDYGDYFWD